ncbi:hypothetical protein C0995_011446 [Termitomyces sp. Mi166|nr:hypothetical protein C0995_011446 [Termitomyces sp. Mi166\
MQLITLKYAGNVQFAAYFVITEPTRDTQWALGTPNPISWTKGVLDNIASFDVEMARLGSNGLSFVARNGGHATVIAGEIIELIDVKNLQSPQPTHL